ncbi:MAG: formylmethanofuran dehydrogenase, partial [Alphaproteobacteria bacterium]
TAVRVRVRADFRLCIHRLVPEFYPLMEKVIKNRAGSKSEEALFKEKGREAAFALIKLPFKEVLKVENVRPELPDYAPIVENAICPACGEPIMATKTVSEGKNRGLCLICSAGKYYQVEGQGIVAKER